MKNEHMIATRLPKDLVQELERIERIEHDDRSTTVRKLLARAIGEWKLDYAARQYGEGEISQARGAREAGVSLWVFQSYLHAHKIPVQYDREDFLHDLGVIRSRK